MPFNFVMLFNFAYVFISMSVLANLLPSIRLACSARILNISYIQSKLKFSHNVALELCFADFYLSFYFENKNVYY